MGMYSVEMKLSLIIPSCNRPELLIEALGSVYSQNHSELEVIIIDDGSEPAVNEDFLQRSFDRNLRVIRNPRSLGIGSVREQGAREAKGDLVWQLDDDDLLAAGAISACVQVFYDNPNLEVLFVNIGCFGRFTSRRRRAQGEALARLASLLEIDPACENTVILGERLLPALLFTVPMAFQHPVVRHKSLLRVCNLRLIGLARSGYSSYGHRKEQLIPDNLNEAEWSIYASAICCCGYLSTPLYLTRCDDQGYFSVDANRDLQQQEHLRLKRRLFENRNRLPELKPWKWQLRGAYAQALLHSAHAQSNELGRYPIPVLIKSLLTYPSWKGLAALMRILMQLGRDNSAETLH
jgi:glycosyltransferase involved in cell wall biosynthesis